MQGLAIANICPDKVTSSSPLHQPFNILRLPPACNATSRYFHLPLHYEGHKITIHVSLHKANLNAINVSAPDFHIWQHFSSNWTTTHLQRLTDIPAIPVTWLYKHMVDQGEPILLFEVNRDTEEEPFLTWKLLVHPGTYIGTIGMTFFVCIGVFCLKRFWCRPTTQMCCPYSSVTLWHVILDDNVEVAPIYRSRGTVEKPIRSHENYGL